jgi:hypothetical protein
VQSNGHFECFCGLYHVQRLRTEMLLLENLVWEEKNAK